MKTQVRKPPVSILFGNLTAKNCHQLLGTSYMSKTELTSLLRSSHCFQPQASEGGRNHCPFTGWPGDTCPSSCHQLRNQHDPRATSPMPKQGSLYGSYASLISLKSETFLLLYKLYIVPEINRGGQGKTKSQFHRHFLDSLQRNTFHRLLNMPSVIFTPSCFLSTGMSQELVPAAQRHVTERGQGEAHTNHTASVMSRGPAQILVSILISREVCLVWK